MVPGELSEPAYAKVNLFLHLLGRRADSYHLLDSLAVFADVGDTLTVANANDLSLAVEGPFAGGLAAALGKSWQGPCTGRAPLLPGPALIQGEADVREGRFLPSSPDRYFGS